MVLFVVDAKKKNTLLKELYKNAGMQTDAQGIALSLPVDDMTDNLKVQLFGETEKEGE